MGGEEVFAGKKERKEGGLLFSLIRKRMGWTSRPLYTDGLREVARNLVFLLLLDLYALS